MHATDDTHRGNTRRPHGTQCRRTHRGHTQQPAHSQRAHTVQVVHSMQAHAYRALAHGMRHTHTRLHVQSNNNHHKNSQRIRKQHTCAHTPEPAATPAALAPTPAAPVRANRRASSVNSHPQVQKTRRPVYLIYARQGDARLRMRQARRGENNQTDVLSICTFKMAGGNTSGMQNIP